MGLFGRKKKKEETVELNISPPKHEHTWKDFPWYMETAYNGTNKWATFRIIEPYVCITCGERKNVKLESEELTNISPQERENWYRQIKQKYKRYLKPRAVVEDMINNVLLVKDPDFLDMVEEMRGTPHRRCGTSAKMSRKKDDDIGTLEVHR